MVVGQPTHHTKRKPLRGDWQLFTFNHKVVVYYSETNPRKSNGTRTHYKFS